MVVRQTCKAIIYRIKQKHRGEAILIHFLVMELRNGPTHLRVLHLITGSPSVLRHAELGG